MIKGKLIGMKLLLAFVFFGAMSAAAQSADRRIKLVHYLLDSFTNGKVRLKNGETFEQLLNYNLITKEMIFEKDGKYLAIAHPEQVDTVYIKQRKFVTVNNAFYEWLAGESYPLFEEFTCTVKEPGVQTGFGASNTTAAVSLERLAKDGGAYGLKLPDKFEVITGHSYYIRKNNEYYKIKNEQHLVKVFPGKKQVIKDWMDSHKTNFSRSADIILLIREIQK